jgi:uncharacterized membrane protein
MQLEERDERRKEYLLLAGLILLATALRFCRLGEWTLEGDEIFTLRDSLNPRLGNSRPLLYFMNHYLVSPLVPLDELGLRLLPALFGVLAVPALYFAVRRLVGGRAALFGALFVAVNHYHLYQSQNARYWSLVFLLSAVYPFVIYLGVRDRNPRQLALGILTAVLAVMAHPTSILLIGGLGFFLATQLRREHLTRLWSYRRARWGALLAVILGGVITARYVAILREWIYVRPGMRVRDHLLQSATLGVKQIGILLSYLDGLTLPLVLAGALGTYLLWRGRDRELALLLVCLFIFPVGFILLVSLRTSVGTTYLIPSLPVFFVGAGVFLDRLASLDWELRQRWLLPAAFAAMIIAAGAPTLISQYRDGRRHDFRGAAHWLGERMAPGDIVFSDQSNVMTYYLPGKEVHQLAADTVALRLSMRGLEKSGPNGALWIVAPYSARSGLHTTANLGSLKRWIYNNCQLHNAIGAARLDFRVKELQIFRCPPNTARVTTPEPDQVTGKAS